MARSSTRSGRCASATVLALAAMSGGAALVLAAPGGTAFADSQPFSLYCPKTPVGDIVLNGAVTTGTISPASPAAGSQFNLTNWQTSVNIPQQLAQASAALGNSALAGSAMGKVDASGATPASITPPALSYSSPLASPIPAAGITLKLPDPASTVGPFTASGGAITITLDQSISLTLLVSGSPLALTCTTYPNNAAQTGIVTTPPSGSPMAPVIASTGSGGSTATTAPASTATTAPTSTPTTAPATTATTAAPVAPTTTAMTGPAPHLWLVALVGLALLGLGCATVFVPRRRLREAPGSKNDGGVVRSGPDDGEPHSLWLRGWGPPEGET